MELIQEWVMALTVKQEQWKEKGARVLRMPARESMVVEHGVQTELGR